MTVDVGDSALLRLTERSLFNFDEDILSPIQLLLSDFLANARSSGQNLTDSVLSRSPIDLGSALAAASHSRDLDDVHWDLLIHPGSIIWAAVIPQVIWSSLELTPDQVVRAAVCGYQALGEMAKFIGWTPRAKWHATTLAGGAGAAVATLLIMKPEAEISLVASAIGLAATVAGGLAQTITTHSKASQFHRSVAVAIGVLAAQSALRSMVPPEGVLSGAVGFKSVFGAESLESEQPHRSVLSDTAIRVFPVNGFAQAAVAAAMQVKGTHSEGTRYTLKVPQLTIDVSTDDGGWWDTKSAVQRVLSGDDLWRNHLARPTFPLVTFEPSHIPKGAAQLLVIEGNSLSDSGLVLPPGWPVYDYPSLIESKWQRLGQDPLEVREISRLGNLQTNAGMLLNWLCNQEF